MGAYNFKPQFEEPIVADDKRHTIRDRRKYPDKPGSLLSLYVGLRKKGARLLKRRQCTRVQDIQFWISEKERYGVAVLIDDIPLSPTERELLARSDGFPDFRTMLQFWEGRLPFEGDLIHWESNSDYARRIGAPWEVVYPDPIGPGVHVLISGKMKLTEADALRRAANSRDLGVPGATVRPALPPERRTLKKRKRK